MLKAAAGVAKAFGVVRDGWNGLNVLHTAAARVGGLDLGFVPGEGGIDRRRDGRQAARWTCCSCWAPTRSTLSASRRLRGLSGHATATRGAHGADVILPGAAYTEKTGLYVNTEGRVQLGQRAVFPKGEAKEDWAILRALSERLGADAALRHPGPAARQAVRRPPDLRPDRLCAGPGRRELRPRRPRRGQGELSDAPFASAGQGLLPDQPDRAGQRDHGRVLGPGLAARPRWRRSRAMDAHDFWATPVGWTLITVGQILLVIVVAAAVAGLPACWRRPQDLGRRADAQRPQRGRARSACCSPSPTSSSSCSRKSSSRPGPTSSVFLLAPLISFILAFVAWAVIPFAPGWVVSNINVGILYLFAISSLGVYGIIMGGWASNSKYPFLGSPALGGADGVLRGLHRLRDHHRDPAGRHHEPDRRSSSSRPAGSGTGTSSAAGCRTCRWRWS